MERLYTAETDYWNYIHLEWSLIPKEKGVFIKLGHALKLLSTTVENARLHLVFPRLTSFIAVKYHQKSAIWICVGSLFVTVNAFARKHVVFSRLSEQNSKFFKLCDDAIQKLTFRIVLNVIKFFEASFSTSFKGISWINFRILLDSMWTAYNSLHRVWIFHGKTMHDNFILTWIAAKIAVTKLIY